MQKFNLNQLKQLFTNYSGKIDEKNIFEVFTDSRKQVKNGLFVPIIGDKFDAHEFIPEAIKNGAVAILSSRRYLEGVEDNFPVFYVNDTTEGLQQLATFYRELINPIVVGITGSNGKTTTKEIVANCLSSTYKVWKTQGNLNNHIGLPMTVLDMDVNTEALVVEMGMSAFGEIELLSNIVKPDYGIITNIGESHIEHLGSREGIAKAKLEITSGFREESVLIIDGDEPLLEGQHTKNNLTCGFSSDNDYIIENINQGNESTSFQINDQSIEIPLLGKHQAKNTAFAYALCKCLNLDTEKVINQLRHIELPSMRFEQLKSKHGFTIINDAYNASSTSMIASIDVLKQMNFIKKIVVLGDILELGDYAISDHERVGQAIDSNIDAVYTVGDVSRHILNGLPSGFNGEKKHFNDKTTLADYLEKQIDEDTVILFKASRGIELEKVIDQLK
ncbi:UDP-N-acetylmuramoyl-tripeptide--D-alanyl-D-alanine ligase [Filobacillus milosensis]|uniref:UDP-N-acetylmuramoyl-tripeptide--D-alanyl-D-alanine ligase n=1 Tax=Filobacillus milosensis TaxID=94137 RepID=A0A4Y8IT51_9BACI|nr:UDP-N-acetylmuramoyl-tripeptide--D-alanyl-D-alanine ligase [Filobacillus milosensis]TFB23300.1 UDP-N-acetylmuramoyl-tripeptide--D-alanyl-D-alanine ligase [Filobacillus milosensis]